MTDDAVECEAGQDAGLKKWYESHLGDMLLIPRLVGAQCFDSESQSCRHGGHADDGCAGAEDLGGDLSRQCG